MTSIVYYARVAERIKIGTTGGAVVQRMSQLQADELLAVEPGGADVEAERHARFASDLIVGEWFYPSEALMEHVRRVSEEHGTPSYRPRAGRCTATPEQEQRAVEILDLLERMRGLQAQLAADLVALNETGIGWHGIGRLLGYSPATLNRWANGRAVGAGGPAS